MLEVSPPIYMLEQLCTHDHHHLTLEDLLIIVLKNGLNEDNAIMILFTAHKLNAIKIIVLTRQFIVSRRQCYYIRSNWMHLLLSHNKFFLIVAKIMMKMSIEYDPKYYDNVFTTPEAKEGTRRVVYLNETLEKGCQHTNARNEFKKDPYRKLSLQNICIKTLEQNLCCENVFDILLHTKVLKLQNLREKIKTFIWTNLNLMKERWQNLEKPILNCLIMRSKLCWKSIVTITARSVFN